jgi:hypothetical protein
LWSEIARGGISLLNWAKSWFDAPEQEENDSALQRSSSKSKPMVKSSGAQTSSSGPATPPEGDDGDKDRKKERTERKYGEGEFWDKLKTSKDDESLRALSRKSDGQVRSDGKYFYKFDPKHRTKGVHLHKYERVRNKYKLIENVDPASGKTLKLIDGEAETW